MQLFVNLICWIVSITLFCLCDLQIHDNDEFNTTLQIESDMQELVQLVVCASSDDIDPDIKQTFLAVAKSYYYAAHFTPATIDFHIAKVLFEPVI